MKFPLNPLHNSIITKNTSCVNRKSNRFNNFLLQIQNISIFSFEKLGTSPSFSHFNRIFLLRLIETFRYMIKEQQRYKVKRCCSLN